MYFSTVNLIVGQCHLSSDLHTKQRPLPAGFEAYCPTERSECISNFLMKNSATQKLSIISIINQQGHRQMVSLLDCLHCTQIAAGLHSLVWQQKTISILDVRPTYLHSTGILQDAQTKINECKLSTATVHHLFIDLFIEGLQPSQSHRAFHKFKSRTS